MVADRLDTVSQIAALFMQTKRPRVNSRWIEFTYANGAAPIPWQKDGAEKGKIEARIRLVSRWMFNLDFAVWQSLDTCPATVNIDLLEISCNDQVL